jgi:hypothetical protein
MIDHMTLEYSSVRRFYRSKVHLHISQTFIFVSVEIYVEFTVCEAGSTKMGVSEQRSSLKELIVRHGKMGGMW